MEMRVQVLRAVEVRSVPFGPVATKRSRDVAEGKQPGRTETFRELAEVVFSGDVSGYRTAERHHTHWRNWPAGGRL